MPKSEAEANPTVTLTVVGLMLTSPDFLLHNLLHRPSRTRRLHPFKGSHGVASPLKTQQPASPSSL
jgi:hypothetical protein